MSHSQQDALHEFISYYVSLIKHKDRLQLIWNQFPADSWLEELVDFWEEFKQMNPKEEYAYQSIDRLVRAVDALLDDIEENITDSHSQNMVNYIFSNTKWKEIEQHARMIQDPAIEEIQQ